MRQVILIIFSFSFFCVCLCLFLLIFFIIRLRLWSQPKSFCFVFFLFCLFWCILNDLPLTNGCIDWWHAYSQLYKLSLGRNDYELSYRWGYLFLRCKTNLIFMRLQSWLFFHIAMDIRSVAFIWHIYIICFLFIDCVYCIYLSVLCVVRVHICQYLNFNFVCIYPI